ncbi:MAG: tetratricopeptide repeat protein [Bacteroidota bacterium]|nr:tetratricopeptide repeat protein [Bacteroidota bacterium]
MRKLHSLLITSALLGSTQLVEAQHTQVFSHPDHYYQEGLELFDREKYGAAQQAFAQYVSLIGDNTKTIDAQYYYALSGLYLMHANSEKLILDFAANYPAHPKASVAYLELGKFYFNKKDFEKSIEYLEKAPSAGLNENQLREAEFKLAYAYFAQKQFDKAKVLFDRNKTGDHNYVYASNYYAGYLAYRNGDYASAKKDLRVAELNDAYKQIVPYMLTEIYYKEGNTNEVISYGEKVLKQQPEPQNADEIKILVGDGYYKKSNYKKALTYFNDYAKGKKKLDHTVAYKLGYANYKTGNYKDAIQYFQPVASQKEVLGQNAAYHLGLSYLKEDNKQFAVAAFDQARRVNFDLPVTESSTIKYAQLNYENGNFNEAINALGEFRKKFPQSKLISEADDILSESFLNTSNYGDAVRHIESLSNRSSRINETYQRVTYFYAVQLFNDGRFQEALIALNKSLEHKYDSEIRAASFFLKGEAQSIAQLWEDAIASYGAVFKTSNASKTDYYIKSRYGIGYAYYNTQQYDKALPHFRTYISDANPQTNSSNINDATIRLADCYYIQKNYSQALALYDKAIDQKAADADFAYFQKGVIYGIQGKREQAVESLRTLVANYPRSQYADEAAYQRALIDFEAGNYAPSVTGFTNLINTRPDSRLIPNALHKRGVAYSNLNKSNEALADFKRVLNDYPSSKVAQNALYSLQEVLAATNQSEEFDVYLARFKAANPQNGALESVEFEAAKSLYLGGKYEPAIPRLETYLKSYPTSPYAPEARYFLADAYLKNNDKEAALNTFKEVIAESKSEYLSRAIHRAAEIEFENKNYPEAITYYSRLREIATSKKDQSNALMGLMRIYFLTNDYENTSKIADELIAQGNASLNAYNSALLYKGKASYAAGNLDQALTELSTTVGSATDANGAEAQYLVGEIHYKQKKYKESLNDLFKVSSNYSAYEYWLGKAFILIADNYTATNELFQAKATLNSVIENSPNQEIVEEAKAKLAALEPGSNTNQNKADSTKTNLTNVQTDSIK